MTDTTFSAYRSELLGRDEPPPCSTDGAALEESARRIMAPGPFGYVAGGAGSGATVRANREAFDRHRIVPRMLRGAHKRELGVRLFGVPLPAPVVLAPIGVQTLVHPDGELAVARAAASVGLPMTVSTTASYPLEQVAAAAAGPRWFQLYWPDDDEVCLSLLDRARRSGYATLVVTADNWAFGWRTTDLDLGYAPAADGLGSANALADPVFRRRLARPPEQDRPAAVARWAAMFTGTDRDWDQLAWLRRQWAGTLLLKGVLHADDARQAVAAGVDGVVVSNHGGRQVDGAVAALDALPAVAAAVGDRATVLFDSGIRTGADMVKALCLGADAVCVGRPYLYGLAHGGEPGVRHVLRSLLADLDLTMALSGVRAIDELRPGLLRPR
ncbi:alpha-hydroxy-acid oxidizing protein [Couchioplanes azureus]|uniref:alpha-hydroxy-acid oxidizing protein n=1 Tax=Couchioplanes caeruleus TaxID=56438 RepID=UPI0016706B8B|nr:alpha-hydroxy-acid oxidizing protein [Couchioplanes caeruleus]GGQ76113.1 L-lactate 2-monooxygenase [Couchioplanes caeruleus subsp. azureus]